MFLAAFTSDRWRALAAAGANLQRPLWASTGVKDPAYPNTLYIDRLFGAGTVTTVPDETLDAFREHGVAAPTLHAEAQGARTLLEEIAAAGIDLDAVTAELEDDGVKRFAKSYDDMIASITRSAPAFSRPDDRRVSPPSPRPRRDRLGNGSARVS